MSGGSFLRKIAGKLKSSENGSRIIRSEEEIIAAVIDRIPIEQELTGPPANPDSEAAREETFRRLVRRLRLKMSEAKMTPGDLLKSHSGPVETVLLQYVDRFRNTDTAALKRKLTDLGFRGLQGGTWLLPPVSMPKGLRTSEELDLWVYQNLVTSGGRELQCVIPFVTVIDLKRTVSESRRKLRAPHNRTAFNIFEAEEIFPASYIYGYMKERGLSVEEIITGGDVTFLASAFCDAATMASLAFSKEELVRRVQGIMGTNAITLSYVATLNEVDLTTALTGLVRHPGDVAQRLIVEAKYWERLIYGEDSTQPAPATPGAA